MLELGLSCAPVNDSVGLTVVIPAYNETHRLAPTVAEVVGHLREASIDFEILVCDDGSTDGTDGLVKRLAENDHEIWLLRSEENRGKGHAVKAGMLAARGSRVLFCDADGATPFDQFDVLARALDAGVDVAVGSRAIRGNGVIRETRWHRRVLGRLYSCVISSRLAPDIKDTQCGFKLFTAPAASTVARRLEVDGFGFDLEIFVIARRHQLSVLEVAVSWREVPGSKVRLLRDSARMVRDAWAIGWRSRAGHYV